MKGFALHNAQTTHGGIIPAAQNLVVQEGSPFLRAGDGHYCPQCKCWSTIQPSHNHIIFDGQAVAYENDLLSCGARILPQQNHTVGDSSGSFTISFGELSAFENTSSNLLDSVKGIFNLKIKLVDAEGIPYKNKAYFAVTKSGELIEGETDSDGYTLPIHTEERESLSFHLIEKHVVMNGEE